MPEATQERLSSRKFMALVATFIASCIFGWFKPEFVGSFSILSTFWVLLLGIYFGANVTQRYNELKNGKSSG